MKKFMYFIVLAVIAFTYSQPSYSQSSEELKAIKEDLKALKEGQANMQKELQEIKTLLKSRPAAAPSEPQNVVLNIDKAPFKGNKNAKLTLIEFSDYQCPFCGRHVTQTLPQLDTDYIKTGKVKYVFLDFPLDFHKNAFKAAEAADCAGEQGKFWQMHDLLFANQKALELSDLTNYAKDLKLDTSKFQKCLDSGKYASQIKKEIELGQKSGVTGTPSFFLGVTNPKDPNVKAVKVIKGAQPYANFKDAIDTTLSSQK
ncbi:MAG TPA: thioredoxin domain-containing protein [Thermodesulfobacteriota bacterium]|nr:thioredoxin domain-containing protein [Thermodesulfobacteriota bacterium]